MLEEAIEQYVTPTTLIDYMFLSKVFLLCTY